MFKRLMVGPIRVNTLVLLISLFFAFILNWPLLLHMKEIVGALPVVKVGFVIAMPFLLVAALNFVFVPLSFRLILKPAFAILFLLSSLASFAAWKYGTVFGTEMIRNIAETNLSEAKAYLSWPLLFWFLLTGVLPTVLLCFIKIDYSTTRLRRLSQRLFSMGASLLVLLLVALLYTKDIMSIGRNNPSLAHEIIPENFIASTVKYVKKTYLRKKEEFRIVAPNPLREKSPGKPTLMFLVVGETARAENLRWNGYSRDTTPFTQNPKIKNMVAFNHVRSCGTSTAVSVPCMFSDLDRTEFDSNIAENSENALDVLQKVGVNVFWIENDGGCKGVCNRLPHTYIKPDNKDFCNGDTCFDDVMLENIDSVISDMAGDKVIAFHMIGSHGPDYSKRYPSSQAVFQPDCKRSDIENCTTEELTNSYDNTIRFTDYVLSLMIKKLEQYQDDYNVLLLFISDHGESLGENGLYLHGAPYMFAPDQQTLVPLMLWMSPGFVKDSRIDVGCISERAKKEKFSHDNIFASLLGLWNVKTIAYDSSQDIFASCRLKEN